MNHLESVDEIRNGQLDMQPEYYNAYVCDSLQERYKIMRNKLPIEPTLMMTKSITIINEVQKYIKI